MTTQLLRYNPDSESAGLYHSNKGDNRDPGANYSLPQLNLYIPEEDPVAAPAKKTNRTRFRYRIIGFAAIIATLAMLLISSLQDSATPGDELHQHTRYMLQDNNWETQQLNRFFYHWNALTPAQQDVLKQQTWFLDFTVSLNEAIIKQAGETPDNAYDHNEQRELLNTLAIVIDPLLQINPDPARQLELPPVMQNTASKSPGQENSALPGDRPGSSTLPDATRIAATEHSAQPVANTPATQMQTAADITPASVTQPRQDIAKAPAKISTKPARRELTRPDAVTNTGSTEQPTETELDDLVNQYISAYVNGDNTRFLKLLSFNAKTNTQSGLKDIQQEYGELFSSTSSRQLQIYKVKWTIKNSLAKGIGNFYSSRIENDGDGHVQAFNGKIQIIAKKLGNGVLITHLFKTINPE